MDSDLIEKDSDSEFLKVTYRADSQWWNKREDSQIYHKIIRLNRLVTNNWEDPFLNTKRFLHFTQMFNQKKNLSLYDIYDGPHCTYCSKKKCDLIFWKCIGLVWKSLQWISVRYSEFKALKKVRL